MLQFSSGAEPRRHRNAPQSESRWTKYSRPSLLLALASLALSSAIGCTVSPAVNRTFVVDVQAVSPSAKSAGAKLPGTVAIDLSDLGKTEKTKNNDSYVGSALVFSVDLGQPLADSLRAFAESYFDHVVPLGAAVPACDYVLSIRCVDMKWWVEYPLEVHQTLLKTKLTKPSGETLLEFQTEACVKAAERGRGLESIAEAKGRAATESLQDALKQIFRRIRRSPAVASYAQIVRKRGPVIPVETPEDEEALAKAPAPLLTGAPAQRWAVSIGISNYKHTNQRIPNLKYAHQDAERFAQFLESEAGGGFAPQHVKVLTNQQATSANIRGALFDFLKRTVKEDLVVIFFSGHGMPDPQKLSNLYLLAHDSNPAQIASTGIPMWDIDTALKRTIAAERVVVLVDACHAAGTTEGVKGVRLGDEFNKYFDALAKAKPGRVVFTSCEGYEVSREGKQWGGGHGVFTWALLEAMNGKADKNDDKIVTLGEVLDYVDITVRRETANEQHPARAGVQFDRSLPMGLVR